LSNGEDKNFRFSDFKKIFGVIFRFLDFKKIFGAGIVVKQINFQNYLAFSQKPCRG